MFELYLAADKPPHPAISTDSQGILPYLDTFDTATVTRQHGSCVVPVDVSETMSNSPQLYFGRWIGWMELNPTKGNIGTQE